MALEVGQVDVRDVQQWGLADQRVNLVGVHRDQRDVAQAVGARFDHFVVASGGAGDIERVRVRHLSVHVLAAFLLAVDLVTAWLDYTDLVVDLFAESSVGDNRFFSNADLDQLAIIHLAVEAPAVDVLGFDFDPVGAAV